MKMKRREVAMTFQVLIDRFHRNKKRLPFHVEDLKCFFQSVENPVDLSMFYFLEIRPISQEEVRIKYSVKKDPYKRYTRTEYLYESFDITSSVKQSTEESELFPDPKFERFLPGLFDFP
jgi:hypothetical protein